MSTTGSQTPARSINGYEVIDSRSGRILRSYPSDKRVFAYRLADRKDREYGAVRHVVRPVFAAVAS